MGSIYSKGDIVFFKNIKLYNMEKGPTIDMRLEGHPFVLLEHVNNIGDTVKCLKCSSNKNQKNKTGKYLIPHKKLRGKKHKDYYVDLECVYDIEIKWWEEVVGSVTNEILNDLIELVKEK